MYIQGQIYINKSAWETCDAVFIQFVPAISVWFTETAAAAATPGTDFQASLASGGEQNAVEDRDDITRLEKQMDKYLLRKVSKHLMDPPVKYCLLLYKPQNHLNTIIYIINVEAFNWNNYTGKN